MIVAGPSGSGKTTFVKELIRHKDQTIIPQPRGRTYWHYGQWQRGYDDLPGLGVESKEGIPGAEEAWVPDSLVVIDDLMCETDDSITKLFTRGSHHNRISVIYIVQNLFEKNKRMRTLSLNAGYLCVFKNPRDSSQISHLGKQMYPGDLKYFQEAYKDAAAPPYGYLFCDLRQETPEAMRLRTNIFDPCPTVYVKK